MRQHHEQPSFWIKNCCICEPNIALIRAKRAATIINVSKGADLKVIEQLPFALAKDSLIQIEAQELALYCDVIMVPTIP